MKLTTYFFTIDKNSAKQVFFLQLISKLVSLVELPPIKRGEIESVKEARL